MLHAILEARDVIERYMSPAPLLRSYELEARLGLGRERRVWLKDYGMTPVGAYKLMGALNWMHRNRERIGDRPVVASSSGNFAAGLAFAGARFGKRVILVMPQQAPRIKLSRTRGLGAEIRTYDLTTDHLTNQRDRMTREIAEQEQAIAASPYDDPDVITGNAVGGWEIAQSLLEQRRRLSHFVCPISGGGLMAGHVAALAPASPGARMIAVEPTGADDFHRSLAAGQRVRIERPTSICDDLCSYDVGVHNWAILRDRVHECSLVNDSDTVRAMDWLYTTHGLRTEPSGAISVAALLYGGLDLAGEGDIVAVISGRNCDTSDFEQWRREAAAT